MNPRFALAVPLVGLSLAVAACGGKSPAEIAAAYAKTPVATVVSDAKTGMSGLKSFHVAQHKPDGKDAGDADITVTATGCHLIVKQKTGGNFEAIGVDGTYYVKGDTEFWTTNATAQAAALLAGRWTKSKQYATEFSSECSVTGLVSDLFSSDKFKDPAVAGSATANGQGVVKLTFTDKDGVHETILVTATSPHLIVSGTGDDNSTTTVSDTNKDVTITAPADALDVDALRGAQ